jgi:hypothetical protein
MQHPRTLFGDILHGCFEIQTRHRFPGDYGDSGQKKRIYRV